jgi:AraC-like DNA-binding protein
MRYEEFDADPALAPWVQCYAEFAVFEAPVTPYMHLVVPDGCAHVTYLRPAPAPGRAIVLGGPRMTCAEYPVNEALLCWDVKLRPHGLGLLGLEPLDWVDRAAPLPSGLAPLARRLMEGLDAYETSAAVRAALDEALLPLLPGASRPDRTVAEAVRAIEASDGREPIGKLAGRLAISERQLQRRFRQAVGLTPKQFSRIRRFRACARNLIAERPEAWGRVAVAHGYSDQAHLNREFARLSGRSPTQLASYIASIEHAAVNV